MTHDHHNPPPDESERELADRLRARGLRMTSQRQSVMAAVTQLVHATPEQIADTIPDVDLTTVYRTLDTLEDLGLLAHTHLGHGAPSYRLASDDHIHVVCHHCGSVVDAPSGLIEPLAERLSSERGFTVDRSHFTVFGTCALCASGASEHRSERSEQGAERDDTEQHAAHHIAGSRHTHEH